MMIEKKEKRLNDSIQYLMSLGLIDNRAASKSIAQKMGRRLNGISSALNGDERYLTWKFVKAFCASYSNIISSEWIWTGEGEMLEEGNNGIRRNVLYTEDYLMGLSHDQLITIVKQLMILYDEQLEQYRYLISQNEEMIRNIQERFKNITNLIYKNV